MPVLFHKPPRMRRALAGLGAVYLVFAGLAAPGPAAAQNCRIHVATGKCIYIPGSQRREPDFSVGDTFPVYQQSMLMNIDRYGLPPVDGNWRYYRFGPHIYRVGADDHRVLGIIYNFRRR